MHLEQTTKVGGKWKSGGLAKAVLNLVSKHYTMIYLTSLQVMLFLALFSMHAVGKFWNLVFNPLTAK
jgi:hypothetical protein